MVQCSFLSSIDKMGPRLASKLIPRPQTFSFPKARDSTGTLTQNPQWIMTAFHDFYANLYKSREIPRPRILADFLDEIPLPKLKLEHSTILEKPITELEVLGVIYNLKRCSAPGPDGFSPCYYRTFASTLAPHLTRFYNALWGNSTLDGTAILAYVSLIPKPGKDSSDVGNYRPISLINNDLKMLTKLIVNRLSEFISGYIHKDQVGLTPRWQEPHQIHRAIDVISLLRTHWDGGPHQEGFLLSVDLQKAFDTMEWPYLFEVLRRWGFGPHFLQILRNLYSNLSAQAPRPLL